MANQIGEFFEAMPDRDEALLGISVHLHNFWEPRMRSQLLGYMDTEKRQRPEADSGLCHPRAPREIIVAIIIIIV